jgi:hypothetical protein
MKINQRQKSTDYRFHRKKRKTGLLLLFAGSLFIASLLLFSGVPVFPKGYFTDGNACLVAVTQITLPEMVSDA